MFSSDRERYNAKCYLSVYVPQASSMQLHTFIPGIAVARRALSVISTPPFHSGSMGKHAPENNAVSCRGNDTIWKMPGQP
ncbi:MAG TPA: hypothetical protein VKU38_09080 [Ktedonobacteraceae bacterium]|nr:hypothetical protein [Ktedonobacteraceae bacterium]